MITKDELIHNYIMLFCQFSNHDFFLTNDSTKYIRMGLFALFCSHRSPKWDFPLVSHYLECNLIVLIDYFSLKNRMLIFQRWKKPENYCKSGLLRVKDDLNLRFESELKSAILWSNLNFPAKMKPHSSVQFESLHRGGTTIWA